MAGYIALSNQIPQDFCVMYCNWLQHVTGHEAMCQGLRETACECFFYSPLAPVVKGKICSPFNSEQKSIFNTQHPL